MKTVLQFSGGKDSLACLYLLQPRWSEITVAWMNTGTALPETLALMREVRRMVPHFLEMRSDVLTDVAERGWPTDVLPVANGPGRDYRGLGGIKLRTSFDCCARNVWIPMGAIMKQIGATEVIRGQRNAERLKSTIRDGHVEDGITYRFPIQDWSEEQVRAFLSERGALPEYYQHIETSLDCWNCTAYLEEKASHVRYLRDRHPDRYAIVSEKLREIRVAVEIAIEPLMGLAL